LCAGGAQTLDPAAKDPTAPPEAIEERTRDNPTPPPSYIDPSMATDTETTLAIRDDEPAAAEVDRSMATDTDTDTESPTPTPAPTLAIRDEEEPVAAAAGAQGLEERSVAVILQELLQPRDRRVQASAFFFACGGSVVLHGTVANLADNPEHVLLGFGLFTVGAALAFLTLSGSDRLGRAAARVEEKLRGLFRSPAG
jgi:hypothetical protein